MSKTRQRVRQANNHRKTAHQTTIESNQNRNKRGHKVQRPISAGNQIKRERKGKIQSEKERERQRERERER